MRAGIHDQRLGQVELSTALRASACCLVVAAIGCGDDEATPSGSYRGSTDNSGFD
jgi:hypothetical protein